MISRGFGLDVGARGVDRLENLRHRAASSEGNIFTITSGMTADLRGGSVFTRPYMVALDAASTVEAAERANAGPK